MLTRFSVLVLILTITHGVNTQTPNVTISNTTNTTNTTTSPPTTILPIPSANTTISPNTTTSPNTTLCPALNATSNQKLQIIDPRGASPPPSSSLQPLPNTTLVTVSCDNGYRMSNDVGISIKCNGTHWVLVDDRTKQWIPSQTPCIPLATIPPQKVCPSFPKLEQQTAKLPDGSIIDNGKYPIDTHIITTCAPGYAKTTEEFVIVKCIEQDAVMKWNGTGIRTCRDIDCPRVDPPPHGRFERPPPSELHVNTSIRIICDPGYHIIRGAGDVDDIITCIGRTGDASWDQAMPECEMDTINNNNNTFIDRNLTGTKEVTNDNKAKNVAGGVIGGILGLALIIICIYCLCAQHARTGRWVNVGSAEPKHDGEELQSMNTAVRGSADDDV